MFSNILGQSFAKQLLMQLLIGKRVPFGLLFYGPESVGKYEIARAFAKALNCKMSGKAACSCPSCKKIDAQVHPDVKLIEPNENGQILIERVRSLISAFEYKRFEGDRKVCIIRRAHCLNQNAANALLKLLEEPKGDATLVLTTSSPERLLDTIRSRCQLVRFSFLSDKELAHLCKDNGIDATDVEVQMMGGSFKPDRIMDGLNILSYLWSGEEIDLDIKLEAAPLRRELVYVSCLVSYMLQNKLNEFRGVHVVRANADKLSKVVDIASKSISYLDRGVRPVLVMKHFETHVRPVIR